MIPRRETTSALQLSSVTPTLCGSQIFYPEVVLCPTQAASSSPSGYSNVCHALALVEGLRWAATVPHYAALHCAALHCAVLHCSALHCSVVSNVCHALALVEGLRWAATVPHYAAFHCAALHCATLHCAALHYTVLHL